MSAGLRRLVQPVTDAFAAPFVALRIPPTSVTLLVLLPAGLAAFFASARLWAAAFVCGAVAGLLDLIDGAVARRTGRVTAFGGFLDSVVDRVVDLAFLLSLGLAMDDYNGWLLVGLAVLGSYGTSYTRARAYEAGGAPKGGWTQTFERGERLIVLGLGALAEAILYGRGHDDGLATIHIAVAVVAVGSLITMLTRIAVVRRTLAT